MIDTSVLVAGLVDTHEHHALARPSVVESLDRQLPGIVLAETWAVLRRAPFNLQAAVVEAALLPWASTAQIAETPASAYVHALMEGRALNLGGNVHDLLIALTCASHDGVLVTLDRRQAAVASTVTGLSVHALLEA